MSDVFLPMFGSIFTLVKIDFKCVKLILKCSTIDFALKLNITQKLEFEFKYSLSQWNLLAISFLRKCIQK